MKNFEIRFDVQVNDNVSIDELAETIKSVMSFGSEEVIDECVDYDFDDGVEVIPK